MEKKEAISKKSIKSEIYELKPNVTIRNNLRYIDPYNFTYQLWVKGRWVNKALIDVLSNEFNQYNKDYFIKAIEEGKVKINNSLTTSNYVLKKGDFLTHSVIRVEHPIINQELEIVFEDNHFLAVDKPSSWPVHVCGGYQFNTLHRILLDEYKYDNLRMLHRLDKHTSGIVILAKTSIAATRFANAIQNREVGKVYLARVKGEFPSETVKCNRSIIAVDRAKGMYTDCDEDMDNNIKNEEKEGKVLEINEEKSNLPKKKKNLDGVDTEKDDLKESKYAETYFERMFYDEKSNTSVVIAKPKTGRTHQIRIHLRYLGFPIANDPCYGGIVYNDLSEFDNPDLIIMKNKLIENSEISVSEIYSYKIWLHAWKYSFLEYKLETKIPKWGNKEYNIENNFK